MILSKYRILIFISFLVFLPLESIQTEEFDTVNELIGHDTRILFSILSVFLDKEETDVIKEKAINMLSNIICDCSCPCSYIASNYEITNKIFNNIVCIINRNKCVEKLLLDKSLKFSLYLFSEILKYKDNIDEYYDVNMINVLLDIFDDCKNTKYVNILLCFFSNMCKNPSNLCLT